MHLIKTLKQKILFLILFLNKNFKYVNLVNKFLIEMLIFQIILLLIRKYLIKLHIKKRTLNIILFNLYYNK